MRFWKQFFCRLVTICSLVIFLPSLRLAQADYVQHREVQFNFSEEYARRTVLLPLGLDDKIKLNRSNFTTDQAVISVYPISLDSLLDALKYTDDDPNDGFEKRALNWDSYNFDAATPLVRMSLAQLAERGYTIDLPGSGAWWVRAQNEGKQQLALVTKSTFGSLAKNADESLVLWSQDFASGQGNFSGEARVYNLHDGIHLLETVSFGADSLATIPHHADADAIVVTSGDKWDFIPLGIKDVQLDKLWSASSGYSIYHAANSDYVFTDKPLYQRGETVYFKAFLRRDDDARFSVLHDPVSVKIYRSWSQQDDDLVFANTYTPDEYGGIDGSWTIPTNAALNDSWESYYVRLSSGGSTSFAIKEYVKPEYELLLTTNVDELITGETLTAHLEGKSFSGHALAGTGFEYCWKEQQYAYDYDNDCDGWQTKTFDENGIAEWDLPTTLENQKDERDKTDKDTRYFTLFVRYSDGLSEPAEDSHRVIIHYSPLKFKFDEQRHAFQLGNKLDLSGQITSKRENVKPANRRVTATIIQYDPDDREKTVELTQLETRSDAHGHFSFDYTPSNCQDRTVIYKVYDEHGHYAYSYDWYNCTVNGGNDDQTSDFADKNSTLKIILDSDKRHSPGENIAVAYQVGDNLIGRQYFSDFGRQRLDRYTIGKFHQNQESVNYKAVDSDQPNTFHDVSLFDRNNYLAASSDVTMEKDLKQINVHLETNQATYAPGDTVKVHLKTTNKFTGKPVSSSVTLWTIDKALYELRRESRRDIFQFFWHDRYHWVDTYHSLQAISVYGAENGGGGDGDIRDLFKDNAYWNPKIVTDQNGEANIEFTLPDNLTTWVLTGVAVTPETIVGESQMEFAVQKDVVARVVAPERLRVGDVSTLGFSVTNYTSQTQNFTSVWEAGEGLQTLASFPANLTLAPGETRTVTVSVKAVSDIAKTKITAGVHNNSAGGSEDVLTKTISILPFGYEQKTSQFALRPGQFDLGLQPDADLLHSTLTVSIAGDVFASLKTAMSSLIEYPRGCVEQTTSRLIPLLMVRDSDLFSGSDFGIDVNKMIDTGLDNLSKLQQASGGWGFWSKDHPDASPFKTAYVLQTILPAEKSATFASNKVEKAAQFLTNVLSRQIKLTDENERVTFTDADLVASVYGLLLVNQYYPDVKVNLNGESVTVLQAALSYYDQLNQADLKDADLLAWTLKANLFTNDAAHARTHLDQLLTALEHEDISNTAANFVRYRSSVADLGLAIQAVSAYGQQYGGQDDRLDVLVTKLLGYRRQAGWANTYETAQAILALDAWHQLQPVNSQGGSYILLLGDQTVGMADFSGGDSREKTFTIALDQINLSDATLTLRPTSGDNDSPVYLTINLNQWRTSTNSPLENDRLKINKAYVRTSSDKSHPLAVGDIVTVYIGIENRGTTQYYINIDDYLPSNLRPLFRNNSTWANRTFTFNGFNGTLTRLSKGMTIISYQAVVTNLAEVVSAPPTYVGSMYDADFIAQTAMTDNITIVDKQPAWISKGNQEYLDIDDETKINPSGNNLWNWLLVTLALVAIVIGSIIILRRRHPKDPPRVITPEIIPTTPPSNDSSTTTQNNDADLANIVRSNDTN